MLTSRVTEITAMSCHAVPATDADRELRCAACATRMFSSRAPALLDAGLRCPRCGGHLVLVPGGEA